MSTDALTFKADLRDSSGKGPARRLRSAGLVPAVVYGAGKPAESISLDAHGFQQLMNKHESETLLLDLDVAGNTRRVLLKEIQHHPVTKRILHVDFNEISMTTMFKVKIPLHFIGIPVGVTMGGGSLDFHLREIEVECLPTDLVEQFDVDVSHLDLKEHFRVSELTTIDVSKYTILTAGDISVVSVAAPRVAGEDDVEGGEEGEAAAEGESEESSAG
jgi:large subunit ribosomal protein L25